MPDELEQAVADALRGIPGLPRPCPHAEGRAVIAALSQAGYSIVRTAGLERLLRETRRPRTNPEGKESDVQN